MKHYAPTPIPFQATHGTLKALESELRRAASLQNLVSEEDLRDLWNRHILDSLAPLLPETGVPLAEPGLWIDIGSGAGLPVLPLAISLPSWRFVAIEPRNLRAQHIHRLAEKLEISNLRVLCAKSESVQTFPNLKGVADVVSTRAVGKIPEDASRAEPFLRVGGRFITFKHQESVASIDGYHPLTYVRYLLPGLEDPRTLLSATLQTRADP